MNPLGCKFFRFKQSTRNRLKRIAERRNQLHENHASNRRVIVDNNYYGFLGEMAVARSIGSTVDFSDRVDGDGGLDVMAQLQFSVNVKTTSYHRDPWLVVDQDDTNADIYLLATVNTDDEDRTELRGWAWGATVRNAPVRKLPSGKMCHVIKLPDLSPMEMLYARVPKAAVAMLTKPQREYIETEDDE